MPLSCIFVVAILLAGGGPTDLAELDFFDPASLLKNSNSEEKEKPVPNLSKLKFLKKRVASIGSGENSPKKKSEKRTHV